MTTPSLQEQVTRQLRVQLAMGMDDTRDIAERVVDYYEGSADTAHVRSVVEAALPILVEERKAEMQSWPAVTDCDRLDAAFQDLNASGIVAKHRWTCCFSCGTRDMQLEIEALGGSLHGKKIMGYVFYHDQDCETAAAGFPLHLAFDTAQNIPDQRARDLAAETVAHAAVHLLRRHKLAVAWEGTAARRIEIKLNWKRRTPPSVR